MAVKTSRVDMKDVYLYVYTRESADETTATGVLFKFSDGNFTFSVKKEKEFVLDRGRVETGSVRDADETPMEVSFEGEFTTLYGDDDVASSYELLMGEGDCLAYAGLGADSCEPYATYLMLANDPLVRRPGCGDGEVLLFKDFFCDSAEVDISAGTLSFSGKCKHVSPTQVPWETVIADGIECTINTESVKLPVVALHQHST